MLYYYIGNSEYLIKEQVNAWKEKFQRKFGSFNLIEIKNIQDVDHNFLSENLTAASFLNEKKLVIICLDSNNSKVKGKKQAKEDKTEFILKLLDKVPENNIILFYQINPDKRNKIYKELIKKSQTKEFNLKVESDIISIINKKYNSVVSAEAIHTITKYKAGNISKIISELDKLLVFKDYIEKKDIIENIIPELEESIFQIIEHLLNANHSEVIKKIEILLNYTNIYAFYNNLLANLRTNVYISKLKNLGFTQGQITDMLKLGNRGFLVNKKHKISFKKLEMLYISLIDIDKKMKTGNLLSADEETFKYEIESKIILI